MPRKSTSPSSNNNNNNSNSNHNDPLLYTALFKRKFVKVFTSGWADSPVGVQRASSPHPLPTATTCLVVQQQQSEESCVDLGECTTGLVVTPCHVQSQRNGAVSPGLSHLRKSPCLQNCLECEDKRSSLPLEVLLYLNARFSIVYFISIIGIYLYKLHQGNLTETSAFISFALLLSVAIAGICVYLSVFQGYVLYIELVISCIQGGFVLIESVLGVAAVAVFSRTTQAAHP